MCVDVLYLHNGNVFYIMYIHILYILHPCDMVDLFTHALDSDEIDSNMFK